MEGSTYSSLGLKMNRTFREKRDDDVFTLKDFLGHKFIIQTKKELENVFARELKAVLQNESIFDLINSFFALEANLYHALDLIEFEVKDFTFDEFYKNLSPLIMRSLLENITNQDNAPQILKSIKESLRIALEEKLYQLDDNF